MSCEIISIPGREKLVSKNHRPEQDIVFRFDDRCARREFIHSKGTKICYLYPRAGISLLLQSLEPHNIDEFENLTDYKCYLGVTLSQCSIWYTL